MTSTGMAHEMAREALEAFALDALDSSERSAVLAHVVRCVSCQQDVTALQAAAAELSYLVRPVPMPEAQRDRIRARLLARAAADSAPAPGQSVLATVSRVTPQEGAHVILPEFHPSPAYHIMVPHSPAAEAALHPPRRHWASSGAAWIAIAASFVAVVSAGMMYQLTRERDGLAAAYQVAAAERTTSSVILDSLRTAMADRDRLIANLTGPQVAVVTLASSGAKAPSARMFWDQSVNAWTFVAHNLPQPKSGRVYQLWLVTANQKISAGVFKPRANGDAVVRATYALRSDALAAVAVTDEPDTGSTQPTTVPFIVGLKSAR